MVIHQPTAISPESPCPYIDGQRARYEYFFASEVGAIELENLFSEGWRKFGMYFFRPKCPSCVSCIPLRIKTAELRLSKSQRRVMKRSASVEIELRSLEYSDEIYEVYRAHSLAKFGSASEPEEFNASFCTPSCPSAISVYRVAGKIIGAGFIDFTSKGLSSVYFCYYPEFSGYSPGTYSAIAETRLAASLGLSYYYLGYYVKGNRSLEYKNRFHPNEKLVHSAGKWLSE